MFNLLGRALSVLAAYEHQLAKEALGPAREASRIARSRTQEELEQIERVRAWRAEGLTHNELQARCIEEGIITRAGSTPTLSTISNWSKGVELPKKAVQRLKKEVSKGKGRRKGARGPRTEDKNAELRAVLISYMKQGMNQTQITRQLAEDGVRNSKGNPYNRQQIQRFVSRLRKDQ